MAEIKISQLPAASLPLVGDEVFPVVQSGSTVKAPVGAVSAKTASIATLRNTQVTDYSVIYVEGYATAGDGGGGYFYSVTGAAPGTYVENYGTVIVPAYSDGSSAWLRVVDGVVSCHQFGVFPANTANVNNPRFAAAVAYVGTAKTSLYIPAGTYALSQAISTTGDLHMYGDGNSSVLDFSGTLSGGYSCLSVSGSLTQIQEINTVSAYSQTVTFVSNPSLSAEDIFCIYNPTDYSYSGFRSYYRAGEWCEVKSVSSATVTLTNPLFAGYTGADVDIYKMSGPSVILRDFRIIGTQASGIIKLSLCNKPYIENISVHAENDNCVYLDRCYKAVIIGGDFINLATYAGGDDYGIIVGNCQHTSISNGSFYSRRQPIDLGGDSGPGCVAVRDTRVTNCVIKNSKTASVPAFDHHGTTSGCIVSNCSIYGGVGFEGGDISYENCTITAQGVGWCVYTGEVLGGTFTLSNCYLYSATDPNALSGGRGFVDVGGAGAAISANTTSDVTIRVLNCTIDAVASTATTFFMTVGNYGSTHKINAQVEGLTARNVSAMQGVVYMKYSSGTAASDFIIVDNVGGFPSGTYLCDSNNSSYLNSPMRMMRQTGTTSITTSTSAANVIASGQDFKYPYPRTPSAQVTTTGGAAGNYPAVAALYSLSSTQIRNMIYSATYANWSAAEARTLYWTASISDV